MKNKPTSTTPGPWVKVDKYLYRYLPSGEFFARFRIKGKSQPIRISLKKTSLTSARLVLRDVMSEEQRKADQSNPALNSVTTFGDALNVLKQRIDNSVKIAARTRFYHHQTIQRILKSWPGIAETPLRKITLDDALKWSKGLHEQYSPSVYNNALDMVRKAFAVGIEAGAISHDPTLGPGGRQLVNRVSTPSKKLELPSDDQWMAILAEVGRNVGGHGGRGIGWLIRFLAYSGARLQEACGMTESQVRSIEKTGGIINPRQRTGVRFRDVDLEHNTITLFGKGSKERVIPMIAELRELIDEIIAARPEMGPDDRLMTVSECQKTLDRCCKSAGCQRITHHDLRHFFATRLIELGFDIPTVARMLGHADGGALAMKVYGHFRMAWVQKRMQGMRFNRPEPACSIGFEI